MFTGRNNYSILDVYICVYLCRNDIAGGDAFFENHFQKAICAIGQDTYI